MALRSPFSPFCTLSVHQSFLKGLDVQPFLQLEKLGVCNLKPPVKLCHHLVTGSLKTQELEDSTLVDVQESSDGYVLFKFGNTQLYDDPSRFISSSIADVKPSTYTDADSEVIDCTALVSRMPEESSLVSPFRWGCRAASLQEDGTSECNNRGPSLRLPTPFIPRKLVGLSSDFLHSHTSGHLADSVVDKHHEFATESSVEFLRIPSSDGDMVKLLPANITLEDGSTQLTTMHTGAVQAMKSTTVRRADKVGKRVRSGHKKPTRNLYRSSSFFQLYELIFSYPFLDSSKATSTWKAIPKEKYTELIDVLNQVAVGLAGSGLAVVLFVASRMLCLNATLDSLKFMTLVRGVGLLWLCSAVQKFRAVVRTMAESSCKGKPVRKEHLAMFSREMHSVTIKICTVVVLSMVRLV